MYIVMRTNEMKSAQETVLIRTFMYITSEILEKCRTHIRDAAPLACGFLDQRPDGAHARYGLDIARCTDHVFCACMRHFGDRVGHR